MTDLTKLADACDPDILTTAAGNVSLRREAAAILRAAAGADVAGLMDVADRYALAQADPAHWRSALESDLRLALAAREGFVLVPVEPTWEMTKAAIPLLQKQDLRVADISVVYAAMIAAAQPGAQEPPPDAIKEALK